MRKGVVLLAAIVAFGTGIPARPATAATGTDKGVIAADYIVVTATVEAIDHERRTITLKGPDSKAVTLRAGRGVKKFGEIRKGDLVSAEYLVAVAVVVRKPDGVSPPGFLRDVSVAPRGRETDGQPVDTVDILGMVESVDHEKRTVTVKGNDGVEHPYRVDVRVKKFRNILKGDKVSVRATEPLAVRIMPVQK